MKDTAADRSYPLGHMPGHLFWFINRASGLVGGEQSGCTDNKSSPLSMDFFFGCCEICPYCVVVQRLALVAHLVDNATLGALRPYTQHPTATSLIFTFSRL